MVDDPSKSPPRSTKRGQSFEVAIGFLVPYIATACALLLSMGRFDAGQAAWAFILPVLLMFFPVFAIPSNPIGLVVLAMIAGSFYAIPRLLPPGYSRYAFGLVFVAWGAYGIRCGEWIAA